MARVTVEDCLEHIDNRFDLVLNAAARAHDLELSGAEPMVPRENDKPTVVALREIAAGYDVLNTTEAEVEAVEDAAEAVELVSAAEAALEQEIIAETQAADDSAESDSKA